MNSLITPGELRGFTTTSTTTVVSISSTTSSYEGMRSLERGKSVGEFDFALADIANNPQELGQDGTARGVTANANFYTIDGQKTGGEYYLRWWSEPEPILTNLRDKRKVNIPHGNPVILGVAFKQVAERAFFAYDIDSHNQESLKKKGAGLGTERRLAHILFRGENVRTIEHWFELYVEDDHLKIVSTKRPRWYTRKRILRPLSQAMRYLKNRFSMSEKDHQN